MFCILTAGESHGPAWSVMVEGMAAGSSFDGDNINEQLVSDE